MKQKKKKIEELNLLDDFLFFEAVSGERGEWFCRLMIKEICNREVKEIHIHPQNAIQGVDTVHHGIRVDLYVDEKGGCIYDFEPDQHTDKKMLPKRNRYYRALLDGRLLDTGESYDNLPDLWTIFIMPYDPFGQNRMCYTVKNMVMEEPGIRYEDGAVSLFLYTKGKVGGSEALSQFLKYMMVSTEANAVSAELKELHQYLTDIKQRKEVGVRYMKSWEFERMWREEGKAEGKVEGKAEALLEILEEVGEIPKDLEEKLREETDSERLSRWIKLAVKVRSIDEFQKQIQKK